MERYRLITTTTYSPHAAAVTTYGVMLVEGGLVRAEARDLSSDRATIENLVRVFNEEQLEAVHFEQAIEDFLYDFRV